MSEGMGMEQFQPTGNQQAVTDEVVFTPEETGQRIKSGETDANRKKTEASIATAANEGTLANTVSGQDASTDPMMWEQWGDLAQNPAARKADYLKRMNMLILGGIMLDAMAAAMGVKSEAGRYMEGQMKLMEAEQKFDDQQRIYDMGRAAYYNEAGEYTPPGSQQEVFDRLMASGATISEASAMSGKHPKGTTVKGYKEYWSLKDGSNIFLPTASAPPPGYTAKRPSGAPGSDPATDPRTAAMKDEALVNEWNSQIQALEAEGNMAAANTLRQRRDNLKNRSGMAAKVGSSDARNLFTALYKSRMGDTYSDPNYFQDPQTKQDIPFDEFYNQWLNAYELKVLDGGVLRTVPGYRKQQTKNPSQSIAQATQSEIPLPDQMSSSDILEIATKQAKDLVASGKPIEEVKELWKRKGFSLDDFPEEYR
ncbi:MAG: hypothetical protein HOG43_07635, partial [Flavobacteriales bacterium]|nr:hypothetical protein [Flavobacteriales bacterium]